MAAAERVDDVGLTSSREGPTANQVLDRIDGDRAFARTNNLAHGGDFSADVVIRVDLSHFPGTFGSRSEEGSKLAPTACTASVYMGCIQ